MFYLRNECNKSSRRPAVSSTGRVEPSRAGVIISHHGVAVDVRWDDGERSLVRVKRRSGHVVGDCVALKGEALERLPRRTELRRRGAREGIHLIGANLDVLGIVVSTLPLPPPGFIDRAIIAARAASLVPFIVVNKCDLMDSAGLASSLHNSYADHLPVFSLSAATGVGLDPLRAFLANHRGAFIGVTGVGKSSLLNALCPEIDLAVGEVNVTAGRGRHTTTVSTLNCLPGGGELIDTPGFHDFGLIDVSSHDLLAYFPGLEQNDEMTCRFRDCRHHSEPGCAIRELVAQGRISKERYESYLVILSEVEASERESRQREWKNKP